VVFYRPKQTSIQASKYVRTGPARVTLPDFLVPEGLLRGYGNNLYEALRIAYPEHQFQPWKFRRTLPRESWHQNQAQLKALTDEMQKQLDLHTMDEWYSVTAASFKKLDSAFRLEMSWGGPFLSSCDLVTRALLAFNKSPSNLIMKAFPNHTWLAWKFSTVSRNFWKDLTNVRKYFEWLKIQLAQNKKLAIDKLEDWYFVTHEMISKQRGPTLSLSCLERCKLTQCYAGWTMLAYFNGSVSKALQAAYPEHRFYALTPSKGPVVWNFPKITERYLTDTFGFMKLGQSFTCEQAMAKLASFASADQTLTKLIAKCGGELGLLRRFYPNHNWKPFDLNNSRQYQRRIITMLKRMYPTSRTFAIINTIARPSIQIAD